MEKIEEYNSQKLKARMDITQEIIDELNAVNTSQLTVSARDEKTQALKKARQYYQVLSAEYVRRMKVEIEALVDACQGDENE